MRTLSRAIFALAVVLAPICFLRPAPLRAETTPALATTAPAPATVNQVGLIAGKSTEALAAFAKLAGFNLPAPLTADGIEQQFPFIGNGGLATDQPIGIALVNAADSRPDQMTVLMIPVKPAAATLESLKAQGATPVANLVDTVMLNGVALRRTADYLLLSHNPPAVAAIDIGALPDAVKGGDALVKISIDLKSVRLNMPAQYKQMLDIASSNVAEGVITQPLLKAIDGIDRLDARLDNGEAGVRLALSAAPIKLPAVAAGNRPGMPPGVIERIDIAANVGDVLPFTRDALAALTDFAKQQTQAGKPPTDEQKKQIEAFLTSVSTLWLDPATTSVGAELIGSEPVVYIVQHWSKHLDAHKQIQQAVANLNALMKTSDPTKTVALQVYTADGVRVLRVVPTESGKPDVYLDVAQKGDDVYMTLSPNQYRYIHHLMAAKQEGPFQAMVSASLDLGKVATAMTRGPNAPLAGMSAESRNRLVELLQGQVLATRSSSEADAATVELTATKGLLQNAPKIAGLFDLSDSSASAPPGPAGAETAMSNARQLLLGCVVYSESHKAWPETLDQIADQVGGKNQLAKLENGGRGANFFYLKPTDLSKNLETTIVLYEAFPTDAPTPRKIVAGYADGHIVLIDPADLMKK